MSVFGSFLSRQLLVFCFLILVSPSVAHFPKLSLDEIAQTADVIFTGKASKTDYVTRGPGVFTEVTFTDIDYLHQRDPQKQRDNSDVILRFAGGEVNGIRMGVCDTPDLKIESKYVVFMLDDGKSYANHIVGGTQGIFEVITDPTSGREIVVAANNRPLTSVSPAGTPKFGQPLVSIGSSGKSNESALEFDRYEPAVAISEDGTVSAAEFRDTKTPDEPMSLEAFSHYLTDNALQKTLTERRLKLGATCNGKLYREIDGQVVSKDIVPSTAPLRSPATVIEALRSREDSENNGETKNNLHACGSQNLPIVMEQLPSGYVGYSAQNDAMFDYNQFMSVFQFVASNGSIGYFNGQNEFCGFVNAQTLKDYFNWEWNGSIGLCIHYSSTQNECVRIQEADIFYNPAYSFVEDGLAWFNTTNPNLFNLRMVAIHELGHAWGYMIKVTETYNYNQPSVMHAGYQDIYETGRGLHALDAYIFRQNYSSQTAIKSITDIGVESYYAENGLNKSTFDRTSYARGDFMVFNNVTVENMSRTRVDSRLRFYLSTTPNFSGDYYQVGSSWNFQNGGLSGETFSKNTYAGNKIPSNVPTGTYYVLAFVDLQSGGTDDYSHNNIAVFTDRVTITAPTISTSTSNIGKTVTVGQNVPADSFTIRNSGAGTLNYSFAVSYDTSPGGWLTLGTYSGTSTGENDSITLNFSTTGLPSGYHTAVITVTDNNATNSGYIVLVSVDVRPLPPPGNDNLANAFSLTGLTGSVTGTNVNATKETGEPSHGSSISKSVWWRWTTPESGTAVISTAGSSFDTLLAVYTGAQYPLNLIASNDDVNGSADRTSRVEYAVSAGTTYRIAVDGFNGATGNIMLNYSLTANSSSVSDWSLF